MPHKAKIYDKQNYEASESSATFQGFTTQHNESTYLC